MQKPPDEWQCPTFLQRKWSQVILCDPCSVWRMAYSPCTSAFMAPHSKLMEPELVLEQEAALHGGFLLERCSKSSLFLGSGMRRRRVDTVGEGVCLKSRVLLILALTLTSYNARSNWSVTPVKYLERTCVLGQINVQVLIFSSVQLLMITLSSHNCWQFQYYIITVCFIVPSL